MAETEPTGLDNANVLQNEIELSDADFDAEFDAEWQKLTKNIKTYLKRYHKEAAKDANEYTCSIVNKVASKVTPGEDEIADAGIREIVSKETMDELELISNISALMILRGDLPKSLQQMFKRSMKDALRDTAQDAFVNGVAVGMGIGRMDLIAGVVQSALKKQLSEAEPSSRLQ